MKEWRTIPGWENYEVSDMGNVRSKDRVSHRRGIQCRLTGKILKPKTEKDGYKNVTLYNGTRTSHKKFPIHRLVAMAFIPNPNEYKYVNHKDEDKGNNVKENLEWCTPKYNSNYGTAIERRVKHQDWKSIADKQSVPVVCKTLSGEVIKRYKSMISAEIDGHKCASISKCCSGKLKTYHGMMWEQCANA